MLPAHGRSEPDAEQKHARHQLATEITRHGEASNLWKSAPVDNKLPVIIVISLECDINVTLIDMMWPWN